MNNLLQTFRSNTTTPNEITVIKKPSSSEARFFAMLQREQSKPRLAHDSFGTAVTTPWQKEDDLSLSEHDDESLSLDDDLMMMGDADDCVDTEYTFNVLEGDAGTVDSNLLRTMKRRAPRTPAASPSALTTEASTTPPLQKPLRETLKPDDLVLDQLQASFPALEVDFD